MTVEDRLLDWVGTDCHDGPTELIRLCLFDWLCCAVAGRDEPVVRRIGQGALGDRVSCITGDRAEAATAALINGTAGHALDYDDTHFDHIGHTSAVVMPTVLALAERAGTAKLAHLLDAALVGSEAAVRAGLWLGRPHYQIGYHQTATSGTFGGVVAGARLLDLSHDQTRHAVGLASTLASGLKGQFGTMGKPLNAGLAARAAVEATLWAASGVTSDPTGLASFGTTHHGVADDTAWDRAERWKIKRVSHKFHACCHGLHAMLEALRDAPDVVDHATVYTHPRWLSVCNIVAPDTGLACKFSFRMTAAMALCGRDTARIDNFSDATAADPQLIARASCIDVQPDDTLSEMQSRVVLTRPDGAQITLAHDLGAPLSLAIRDERLKQKARAIIGADLSKSLWAAVTAERPQQLFRALYELNS